MVFIFLAYFTLYTIKKIIKKYKNLKNKIICNSIKNKINFLLFSFAMKKNFQHYTMQLFKYLSYGKALFQESK